MGEPDFEARRMRTVQTTVLEHATRLKVRRCRLQCLDGADAGKELVSDRERVRVGTDAACDLVLADPTASRVHFALVHTERGYRVEDLDSTNGTFLDGRRIERAYLAPGSRLLAGKTTLLFSPVEEELTVEPDPEGRLAGMIGQGARMRQLFGLLRKIAPMDVPVVVRGETGTGKERVARALHALSGRAAGPFVVLDCGAVSDGELETELFGEARGARAGVFERAHGGTLLLDAIDELRLELQPKLLRVLESRELRRLGGEEVIDVDVRVVAATQRDLAAERDAGHFRDDLYFRLAVIELELPPLRDRPEDVPLLVREALADPELIARAGARTFSEDALAALRTYAWPGNVRELLNVVAHAATLTDAPVLDVAQLPPRVRGVSEPGGLRFNEHLAFKDAKEQVLQAFEREYLDQLLRRCDGNVSRAARESGLHRKSIERLIKKYQLDARALRAR